MYKIPSELLHGDDATNSGIVKGSFFNGSLLSPTRYNDPSLGSGKSTGTIASLVSVGTLTTGSETKSQSTIAPKLAWHVLSLIFHLTSPVSCSIATKFPSKVAKINSLSS